MKWQIMEAVAGHQGTDRAERRAHGEPMRPEVHRTCLRRFCANLIYAIEWRE